MPGPKAEIWVGFGWAKTWKWFICDFAIFQQIELACVSPPVPRAWWLIPHGGFPRLTDGMILPNQSEELSLHLHVGYTIACKQ